MYVCMYDCVCLLACVCVCVCVCASVHVSPCVLVYVSFSGACSSMFACSFVFE